LIPSGCKADKAEGRRPFVAFIPIERRRDKSILDRALFIDSFTYSTDAK
jgi:hypothetical protein